MGVGAEGGDDCYREECYEGICTGCSWKVRIPFHTLNWFGDRKLILPRLVSVARGEQQYFSPEGIPTATEGCKSNALMRCCKDLGVASELWDPRFIRKFMKSHAKQIWVEHVPTKKKKQIWLRIDDEPRYPFRETKFGA